jgi:S-layer protein
MVTADVVTADNDLAFSALVSGFEKLELTGSTGGQNINLTNMGITSDIIVGASAGAGAVTLTNLANGGTVTQTGTHATGVTVSNAAFTAGTADSVNVVLSATAGFNGGTFTAANVETVNLTATDTLTTDITAHILVMTADSATTLNVSGNAGVALTLTGSVALAVLNASAATGGVSATSVSTAAITMHGGSGGDSLTAATGTNADVLNGNAGADTLTTNAGLTTLTGGAGFDNFVIQTAGANGAVYTTITDFSAGDRITLDDVAAGDEVFNTTKLTLAGTAVFTDYLNAATDDTGSNVNSVIRWFQFGGNTYIVQDKSASADFFNGTDVVVALTGIIDLSTASLSYNLGSDPVLMI